ncbi:MAG: hypothetical protein ACP5QA_13750 [Phycisphaerae bacterium]
MSVAESEQSLLPSDQVDRFRCDGQIKKVIVLGVQWEEVELGDPLEPVGRFEGLLQDGGGVLRGEAGQAGLKFGAEEKVA